MAKALFITTKDIKRYSVLSGSVDPDKFIYMVEIAQDTEVQNYLGTQLLEKIQALILAGTINDPANAAYKTLLETYVKPMTIYWALVCYMPFAAYTVANGGVYKHTSESSVTVDKDEVDYLVAKAREYARYYSTRLVDYLCDNSSKFPEYTSNSGSDISPDSDTVYNSWVL